MPSLTDLCFEAEEEGKKKKKLIYHGTFFGHLKQ